jgi:hypothetical protein
MNITRIISILIALTALGGCSKPDEPVKPANESASGQAATTGRDAASNAEKSNADLAKIREIKEQEKAEREAAKKRSESNSDAMAKGAAKPIRDLKY